jgi:site-specific DNA recombinase
MGSLVRSVVRALLYVRVSTDEQARSGFSLGQQLEALRSYCQDHNIEIVAEFEDRSSAAYLDRPGLDTLRDVVCSGGIDLVLAQDADRITRDPMHRAILDDEFGRYETRLVALDDWGDDSHEGELLKYMKGWVSKGERLKIAERTRRGRVRKAQEGKVVGNGSAPFGYLYRDNHYHIDPGRMPYVHEIFERAAVGDSLYSIVQHLNNIGAPTPKGKKWHTSTLRNIISSDTYLGTFYWAKERYTTTTISKTYKRKVKREKRPESEWISIPVPHSGISTETVARARESLKGNAKSVSKNGGRIWEISGGIAKCSVCGRHMVAHTSRNTAKRTYYYYRCSSNREHQACSNRKNRPARDLEMQVTDAIVGTFQEETWGAFVKNACDQKIAELRRLGRGGTEGTKERLAGRISDLENQKSRTRYLFTIEDLTLPEYEENRDQLQDQIETLRQELSKVDNLEREILRWEELRKTLLDVKNPLEGLPSGPEETAARDRQGFYSKAGLRVKVGEENLEITLGMDRIFVSKDESVSEVIAAPAPAGAPGSLSRPLS